MEPVPTVLGSVRVTSIFGVEEERTSSFGKTMKKKKKLHLRLIHRLTIITCKAFRDIMLPGKSEQWSRGILADYKQQGLIDSHPLPMHKTKFYFLRKKATRLLGVNSNYTHTSTFKPRGVFEMYGRMLFATQAVLEPGVECPRILRPSEFKNRFPQLAEHAPDKYYAIDAEKNLLAIHVVGLPQTRRLVSKTQARFCRYMEHELFRDFIVENRFKLVLILPSEGKKESVEAELLLRESRLVGEHGQKADEMRAFAKLLRRSLVLWSSDDLGRLIT